MCWSGEYYMLPISTYVRDYATEGSIPRRIWERKGGDGKMEGIEEEKMVGEMMVDEWCQNDGGMMGNDGGLTGCR